MRRIVRYTSPKGASPQRAAQVDRDTEWLTYIVTYEERGKTLEKKFTTSVREDAMIAAIAFAANLVVEHHYDRRKS